MQTDVTLNGVPPTPKNTECKYCGATVEVGKNCKYCGRTNKDEYKPPNESRTMLYADNKPAYIMPDENDERLASELSKGLRKHSHIVHSNFVPTRNVKTIAMDALGTLVIILWMAGFTLGIILLFVAMLGGN